MWQNKQPQAQTSFHEKTLGHKIDPIIFVFFCVLIERKFGQNKEKKSV